MTPIDVVSRFRQVALEAPGGSAIVAEGCTSTYGELLEEVDIAASALRALEVGSGDRVGVCIDRSAGAVVSIIAVLAVGAAYVPLDPGFPFDRLVYMAKDSDLDLIIVGEDVGDALVDRLDRRMIRLPELRGSAEVVRSAEVWADAPAYVIYTSGSTGRPKGVVVHQAAVARSVGSMLTRPAIERSDVILGISSLSFDVSVADIWLALTTGATLVIATTGQVRSGPELAALIDANGVTAMQATPTTWQLLALAGWCPPRGFKLMTGGEVLPAYLVRRFLDAGAEVWNLYGPTEATIWSSAKRLRSESQNHHIGEALGDRAMLVVDQLLRPVADGVKGELCIGGPGLAEGYLGRPDLTAERFVVIDCGGDGKGRFFRTGDIARRLPSGEFELFGRVDHQVKLRGHRIELGEIEATIMELSGVGGATVVIEQIEGSTAGLAAYVSPLPGASLTRSSLVEHVRATLPAYMLPARWFEVDVFPQTPTRKVDREALQRASFPPLPDRTQDLPPAVTSPLQDMVCEVWNEVLGGLPPRLNDNFFDLGGTSVAAVEVTWMLEERLGHEVSIQALFEAPDLASYAAVVEFEGAIGARIDGPTELTAPRETG